MKVQFLTLKIRYCALLVSLAMLAGCSSSKTDGPSGTISGKVTYNGKPVTEGLVQFYNADTGQGGEGKIDESGNFKIETGIPVGEYSVFVTPPETEMAPGDTGDMGEAPVKQYPNIPERYRDASTSPIKVTIKEGDNDAIEIKMEK